MSTKLKGTKVFTLRKNEWYKRRDQIKVPNVCYFIVSGYKQIQELRCTVHVFFDDGTQETYLGRVLQNKITGKWAIDAMHIIIDVEESMQA